MSTFALSIKELAKLGNSGNVWSLSRKKQRKKSKNTSVCDAYAAKPAGQNSMNRGEID